MAKSAATRSSKKAPEAEKPTEIEQLEVRVVMENDDSEPVYANFAEISRGQYECEIAFSRTPAKITADRVDALRRGEPIAIYPSVKVIVPSGFLPKLAEAIAAAIAMGTEKADVQK